MNDIYTTLEADLRLRQNEGIDVFNRFSTWYVVLLTLITISFYLPYWLYTRSEKLNTIVENPISKPFMLFCLFLYAGTFISAFAAGYLGGDATLTFYADAIGLAANVVIIVWAFMFGRRLRPMASAQGIKVRGVLIFLGQNFYLQYKINEVLDATHSRASLGVVENSNI